MSVGLGEVNRIDVSPFVARSPHVLYTNVVEPVLRWVLVRRGYALTHAACLSLAGKGLFITAKADTGKTTTMLKSLLARPDATFLADDMVIVGVDGTVLSYPKPLTISKQTLQAVGSRHTLTLRERMILPVQSLLHSKHGRWLGKFFAQLALPTATLNAIVQRIVPPPKFRVERIVPNVKYGNRARLSQIVLIERGNQMEESISAEKLPAILVENAEDAFRFPPYGEVEQQLCKWQGADLHSTEYEIIQSATKQCNGVRIVDPNFGWWRKVPQLMAVHSPSVNDLKVAEA